MAGIMWVLACAGTYTLLFVLANLIGYEILKIQRPLLAMKIKLGIPGWRLFLLCCWFVGVSFGVYVIHYSLVFIYVLGNAI
jgi:hypothetical protein